MVSGGGLEPPRIAPLAPQASVSANSTTQTWFYNGNNSNIARVWQYANRNIGFSQKMATPPGFEPRLSVPKTLVLPLHHGVKPFFNIYAKRNNSTSWEWNRCFLGEFFNSITGENG